MTVTEHVRALGTESAFGVAAQARRLEAAGRNVVHLEIGEPGVPTAPHIVEAGIRALRDGHTGYVAPLGIPELREAIAHATAAHGIPAHVEHVVVTSGGKPAIFYAALALIGPGDDVLVPDPGFPIYPSVARLAGGRPVSYAVDLDGAGVTAAAIAAVITPRSRVLFLNSPHNPTGSIIAPGELDAIAELVLRHDLAVVSDEVYARLVFDGRCESIASRPGLAERTIVVDSFSKTYAMTGWRLGFGIVPAAVVPHIERLVINNTSCTPPFVQRAGVAALTGTQQPVADLVARLRGTRDALVRGLAGVDGVVCPVPPAAFYAFPDVTGLLDASSLDTDAFASRLLDEFGVATLAGGGFGPRGDGRLRFSYATSPEHIATALDRVRACAAALVPSPTAAR